MTTVQQPPIVLHARDNNRLTASDLRARLAWLEAHGIDPVLTYRVDVLRGEQPTATVYVYDTDEKGNRYCRLAHNHRTAPCETAQRPPQTITVTTIPPTPQCPGPCNAKARKARAAYETAIEQWPQTLAAWERAHEYWLARVAEAGPENAFREPVRPRRPTGPDVQSTPGEPVWCRSDTALVRRALADLDDLAAILQAKSDGHRGRTSEEKTSTRSTESRSPSPIADTLDDLYSALTTVEDQWREARSYSHRPQRGRNGHARTSVISWLLEEFDDILRHPGSEQFGKTTLRWQARLEKMTASEPVVRRRPGRCVNPNCGRLGLRTRADGYTTCPSCGRLYHEDQYQEDVVDAQVDEPIDTKAQAS